MPPTANTVVVPGGVCELAPDIPSPHDEAIDALIRDACRGLRITPEALRDELVDDMDDLRAGVLTPEALRLVAETLDLMRSPGDATDTPQTVTCSACSHYQRVDGHPHLGRCGAGIRAPGGSGLWWDNDYRACARFTGRGAFFMVGKVAGDDGNTIT
jgi:hypothetical protein